MTDCYVCKKFLALGFERFIGLCLKCNEKIDRETTHPSPSNVMGK